MRRSLPLASLVALFVLAGCGGDSTTTVTSTGTTSTTEQSSIDTSGEFTFFALPSGNIGCAMSSRDVRCDITDYDYAPPPQPGSCPLDWGDSISVSGEGSQFVCHGDTVFSEDAETLAYGTEVSRDGFTCSSSEQGVRCESSAGAGFTLAREAYDLF